VLEFNEQFVRMWDIPLSVMAARVHRPIQQAAASHVSDPKAFLARINEIYVQWPETTADLIELTDGRVFERVSKIQRVGDRRVGRVWSFRDLTDRLLAERKMRESREWFEVTLSSIGDAVITTDVEGKVTFMNPVAEALTGWKLEEARGWVLEQVFNIVSEITGEAVENPVAKVLVEGVVVGLANHTALVDRSGHTRAIEDSAAPIRDTSGRIVGVVMVFHDVTERRRAEEARLHLAAVVESSDDAIVSKTLNGIIQSWNKGAERIFGYTADEVVGKSVTILIPPDRLDEEPAILERLRRGERIDHYETIRRRKDGRLIDVALTISPIKNGVGQIVGASKIARDVTARKKAEEARQWLAAVVESSDDAILSKDLNGTLTSWNKAAERIFGYTADEVIGKSVTVLIPEDRLSEEPAILARLRRGERIEHYETVRRRKDGTLVDVSLTVSPIRGGDGRILGASKIARDITDRKRGEETLRRQTERLHATFNQAAVGIAISRLDGSFEQLNQRFAEIVGFEVEELHGRTFTDITHPDDLAPTQEAVARLLEGKSTSYAMEKRYVRKDGRVVWSLTNATVLKDAQGKAAGFVGVIEDITRRKEAEEAVHEWAQRLQLALSAGRLGDWTWYPEDDRLELGTRAAEIFGLAEGQGMTWTKLRGLLHEDDQEPARIAVENALREHADYDLEYRVRLGSGEVRWVAARGRGVFGLQGEVLRMTGVVQDISDRRRAEDAIWQSAENYRLLAEEQARTAAALREEYHAVEHLNAISRALATELDLKNIVQIITDSATQVTRAQFGVFFYNQAAESGEARTLYARSGVLQSEFEKFPTADATKMFGPAFRAEGVVRIDDVRKDPRFGRNPPYEGMPIGHLPVVSYLALPVKSRSGEVMGGLVFGHGAPGVFTEREERITAAIAAQAAAAMDTARAYEAAQLARAAAEQASLAKDHFLAALSHELRTPLTPVLAILSSLTDEPAVPPAIGRDLHTMRRNVELEARLIDDLLDLTRITRGKLELHCDRVPLAQVLENALNTCEPELRNKQLHLVRELRDSGEILFIDEARITQVLWNLLRNAIKFTPQGGTITLRSWVTGAADKRQACVEIQDTGIGIEPDRIDRIFEAFEQGDRRITQQFGGLGLGLAISRAIAQLHGGTIKATSQGPGHGSTFKLTVRCQACDVLSKAASDESPVPPTPAKETRTAKMTRRQVRILLVEDHHDTAVVLARMLRRSGYDVIEANSVSSALAAAEKAAGPQPLDLVISDIGLPDASGLDMMRELSSKHGLRGIALSGFGMESDREQSSAAGFARHLIKPVNVSLLRSTIAELVAEMGL
jgi:PAS domain S-box-containing protein